MIITLPYPPTANLYWRKWRGRIVKSGEAREYQRDVGYMVGPFLPISGPVRLSVTVYRPRKRGDLDNTLKVLLDALKGHAFHDDAQVVELHATRHEDPTNPRVVVQVEPLP